jgi:hypothetical protein
MDPKYCVARNPENVEVKNYNVELISFDHPLMEKVYGIKSLPLKQAKVTIDLHNVSTATANSIRRTIIDEVSGYAFDVGLKDYEINEHSDKTAIRHYVISRINAIPLKCVISDDILQTVKFSINIFNSTNDPMFVTSSDLQCNKKIKDVLFNPNYIIACLNPGTTLRINNIRIVKDIGLNNTYCKSACNVTMIPLDREIYTPEELEADHALKLRSKFKYSATQVENIAHRITFKLNAVENKYEAEMFLQSAIKTLITNFNIILNEDYSEYVSDLEGGIKMLKFESPHTNTISEALKRSIFDITKNKVMLCYYTYSSSEHVSTMIIKDTNPLELLHLGITNMIAILTKLLLPM